MQNPITPQLGNHLILEVWNAKNLENEEFIRNVLIEMTEAAGATLLKVFLHHFGEGFGVTGVAVLAESHISIHTWPEHNYAAIDVFMCGDADVNKTIPVVKTSFSTESVDVTTLPRGILTSSPGVVAEALV